MGEVGIIGLDLPKRVIQVHGACAKGSTASPAFHSAQTPIFEEIVNGALERLGIANG